MTRTNGATARAPRPKLGKLKIYSTRPKKRARLRGTFSMATLRIAEINRVFLDRYGPAGLPDDDAGRDDARLALYHLAKLAREPERRMQSWLATWCPWMAPAERDELVLAVLVKPLKFRADTLAERMGLTAADRHRLGIRTIGAVDEPREQRKAKQRERRRLKQEARRRAIGAKPRAEYLAEARRG